MDKEDLKNCFNNIHTNTRVLWYMLQSRISAYDNIETDQAVTAAYYIHEKAVLDIIENILKDVDNLDGHIEFIPDAWEEE